MIKANGLAALETKTLRDASSEKQHALWEQCVADAACKDSAGCTWQVACG
jgi:hypothetical protein